MQVITNFQDTTRQIISRKIIPLVKYDNPNYSKSTTPISKNDYTSSQNYTNNIVKTNKYINNNKYNNYKYNNYKNTTSNYNEREYSIQDFDSLYANNDWNI